MSLITTIIDGLAPNPSSGLGGANEGHIQGFQDDIINGIAGGVADKAGGQCLVTQNSPLGMSVLVADGVVYIPNADYIANLATATKYYRVVIKAEDPVTIPSNTSGDTCQHGLDVVIDKDTVPNEYGSNVATLVVTLGTPGAGAPAVPDNGYRLAEVEVVNGATQIATASITDTRTQISINDVVISTNIVTKTGTQTLSNKTLTSPVINTGFSGTAKASASDVTTGTEDAKIVTPKAIADSYIGGALSTTTNSYGIYNTSMARQALINGNFDVWQRGTSLARTNDTTVFLADHWRDGVSANGGTLPTITVSQQTLTSGDISNAYYHWRLATNGAGTSLGNGSYHTLQQPIEFGTRYLCGNGKKVTISFWARSSIANKRIGIDLQQNYGTGGSPTSTEDIVGVNWTLTSSWVKYTTTFTTNTLASKTFGTSNNDYLQVRFWNMWGSNYQAKVGASTAETYVGSGNIDIAQVQLCAGDVALPFQPKSFEEELRACMRYYEKSYDYATAVGTASAPGYLFFQGYAAVANGSIYGYIPFKVKKRAPLPTIVYRGFAGGTAVCSNAGAGTDLAANSAANYSSSYSECGVVVYNNSGGNITPTSGGFILHYTCESEL